MKNIINYFYGIIVNKYKKRNNNFVFFIDKDEFEFVEFYDDINILLNTYMVLKNYQVKSYKIIKNKNNELITQYNNKIYILLKKEKYNREELNLDIIFNYDRLIFTENNFNWKHLWMKKIDYYNSQIEDNSLKYPILNETFTYYLGLSEIAISMLNFVDYKNIRACISHKRIEGVSDLYNPLNIILDNKSRDIAEYVKSTFFNSTLNMEEFIDFIYKKYLNKDEIFLLLARLLYPSYYFDAYDKIYKNINYSNELNKIIERHLEYEKFLKKTYNHIKKLYVIPQIEFLED